MLRTVNQEIFKGNYHQNASEETKEYCKMCEAMLYEPVFSNTKAILS